jgi:hypothetical protein
MEDEPATADITEDDIRARLLAVKPASSEGAQRKQTHHSRKEASEESHVQPTKDESRARLSVDRASARDTMGKVEKREDEDSGAYLVCLCPYGLWIFFLFCEINAYSFL